MGIIKIKKSWLKFILLAVSAALTYSTVCKTLSENQFNYVYPMEADSIGMPMAFTLFNLIALIPFAVVFSTASLSRNKDNGKYSVAWLAFKVASYLFSYLLLTFVTLVSASYWNTPHHYVISNWYLALVVLIQAFFVFDLYQIYKSYRPR
ncbi:hypothetical protein MCEKH37_00325 [Methylophilaceae bacterium]